MPTSKEYRERLAYCVEAIEHARTTSGAIEAMVLLAKDKAESLLSQPEGEPSGEGFAETFHPFDFVVEELIERSWSFQDLAREMGGDEKINLASLEFLSLRDPSIILGEDSAKQLAKAFGTDIETWVNLDKSWREGRREGQRQAMTEVEALAERLFEPIHDGISVADFMGMAFEYGFWTGTTAPDKSKHPFLVEKRKRFWDILKAKGWKCGNVFAGREHFEAADKEAANDKKTAS